MLLVALLATPAAAFEFADVSAKAQALAKEPFQDPKGRVPEWLLEISYDQWRDIRFRANKALWGDVKRSPFQVQFFHPDSFTIDRWPSIMSTTRATSIRFPSTPANFDYGRNDFASRVPQDLGYAGFPGPRSNKKRRTTTTKSSCSSAQPITAPSARTKSSASPARGLAIDTALPSGEEFPYFREFWLMTPAAKAKDLTVYALLDSPSLAGAYQFVIRPGERAAVEVEGRIFMRREVHKLGIGPLTSMFFHGENTSRQVEDFRPEVHDSDGLLLHFDTGEWLWRPLDNPRTLNVNGFRMQNPRGFGFVQRDRDFDHYQDLETRAERRPSAWLVPKENWGDGRVELVEIPTKSDTNDNVVTYWVPDAQTKADGSMGFAYTLYWYGDDPTPATGGRVIATRRDRGNKPDVHRFVVEFAGPALEALPADTVLRGVVTVASGKGAAEIIDQHVVKNPVTGSWRLTFQLLPKQNEPIELRAFLDRGGETLTETWAYVILP